MDKKIWQWEHTVDSQRFIVSSDKTLLPLSFVQDVFGTEAVFWANPLSDEATRAMLDNSLTLGLYKVSPDTDEKTPIGMARMVTDYTTLVYLTDVYISDAYRSFGLGKWIVRSCRSIAAEMENLRFMVLLTGSEQAQNLYRAELGMALLDGREQKLACMGARRTNLAEAAGASRSATA